MFKDFGMRRSLKNQNHICLIMQQTTTIKLVFWQHSLFLLETDWMHYRCHLLVCVWTMKQFALLLLSDLDWGFTSLMFVDAAKVLMFVEITAYLAEVDQANLYVIIYQWHNLAQARSQPQTARGHRPRARGHIIYTPKKLLPNLHPSP